MAIAHTNQIDGQKINKNIFLLIVDWVWNWNCAMVFVCIWKKKRTSTLKNTFSEFKWFTSNVVVFWINNCPVRLSMANNLATISSPLILCEAWKIEMKCKKNDCNFELCYFFFFFCTGDVFIRCYINLYRSFII